MNADDLVFALYELLLREGRLTKPQIARVTGSDLNEVDAAIRAYRLAFKDDGPALLEACVGRRKSHVYWLSEDPREIKRWGLKRMEEILTRAVVTSSQIAAGLRYADDDSLEARQLRHLQRRLEFSLDELRDATR